MGRPPGFGFDPPAGTTGTVVTTASGLTGTEQTTAPRHRSNPPAFILAAWSARRSSASSRSAETSPTGWRSASPR